VHRTGEQSEEMWMKKWNVECGTIGRASLVLAREHRVAQNKSDHGKRRKGQTDVNGVNAVEVRGA